MVKMLLAGFGGQGVLFAGKVIAYAGMLEDKFVSWMPSYGPEMRGGTANCSVCISEQPIGSPLVNSPDIFIAMNKPSYDKFITKVAPGGVAVVDQTLVTDPKERNDITSYFVSAASMAKEARGFSNIILIGKAIKEAGIVSLKTAEQALLKCIPAQKQELVEPNLNALRFGAAL